MAKPKPKKLSKAEKEELRLALEAEQKQRDEDEETRQDFERADAASKAKEASAEMMAQMQSKLAEVVADGAAAAEAMSARQETLQQQYGTQAESSDWAEFLECSELPDVRSEAELNTYAAEWREAPRAGLAQTVQRAGATLGVCAALSREITRLRARGGADGVKAAALAEQTPPLRALALQQLDAASAHICQHADEFASDKNEVIEQAQADGLSYGMWVNLALHPRTKQVEFAGSGVVVEIPRTLALASIALRVVHFAVDPVDRPSKELVLGGPLIVDLLALPPRPKVIKQWTMRQITALADTVLRLPYPIPAATGESLIGAPPPPPPSAQQLANAPMLRITMKRPAGVMIRGKPRVGWWDADSVGWSESGVDEVALDEEAGTISFKTVHVSTLALLQSPRFDLPFSDWHLSPKGENAAVLRLSTPFFVVQFEVREGGCLLVGDVPADLQSLAEVVMSPRDLLGDMASAGLSLLADRVNPAELEGVSGLIAKDEAIEAAVHAELALGAAALSFQMSKWNGDEAVGARSAAVQVSDGIADGQRRQEHGEDGAPVWQFAQFVPRLGPEMEAFGCPPSPETEVEGPYVPPDLTAPPPDEDAPPPPRPPPRTIDEAIWTDAMQAVIVPHAAALRIECEQATAKSVAGAVKLSLSRSREEDPTFAAVGAPAHASFCRLYGSDTATGQKLLHASPLFSSTLLELLDAVRPLSMSGIAASEQEELPPAEAEEEAGAEAGAQAAAEPASEPAAAGES